MFMDRLGWLAFAIPFGFWLWMAGPSPEGFDAPGVVVAAFSLRDTHPLGHPLALLLGHGFSLLPLGSLSFRMTVASAFFLASASWLSFQAGVHLLVLLFGAEGRRLLGRGLVLCGVGVVMLSGAVCAQAIRPGFLAMYLVLLCAVWERSLAWLLLPEPLRNTRGGGLAVLSLGLALAVFPVQSAGYVLGCMVLLWMPQIRLRWWHGLGGVGLLLVGLSSYLYLPARASQTSASWLRVSPDAQMKKQPVSPGDPVKKIRVVPVGVTHKTPSNATHSSASATDLVGARMRTNAMGKWFFSQAGWLFFLLGLIGLGTACMREWSVGGALILWCGVGPWVGSGGNSAMDQTSLQGVLIPSLLVLGWGFAIALFWIAKRWKGRMIAGISCCAVFLTGGAQIFPCSFCERGVGRLLFPATSSSQTSFCCQPQNRHTSLLWSELMEELLPRDALVLTREAHHSVLFLYRQVIERQRPDIAYVPRDLHKIPRFVRKRLVQNIPSHRLLLRLQERDLLQIFGELRKISEGRPVCLEWFDDLPAWIAQTAYPMGLLFVWDPENPVPRDARGRAEDDERMAEQQRRFWREAYALLQPALDANLLLREILQVTHILHAQAYLQSGRWRAAKQEIVHALRWQGHEPKLRVLQKRLQPHLDTLTPLPLRR